MWAAEKISDRPQRLKSRKSKEKPTGDEAMETIHGCREESTIMPHIFIQMCYLCGIFSSPKPNNMLEGILIAICPRLPDDFRQVLREMKQAWGYPLAENIGGKRGML